MKISISACSAALLLSAASASAQDSAPPATPPPAPDSAPATAAGPADLVAVVARTPALASLRLAIDASGLNDVLASTGPFTLLAPSDEAFSRLDKETLASLMAPENQAALAAILAHHVLPGRNSAAQLASLSSAPSLSGQRLEIRRGPTGPIIAGGAISQADIPAINGVIHVIDTVLLPTTRDIRSALDASGRFTTFLSLLDRAGDTEFFAPGAQVTLFAPTDDAFKSMPPDTIAMLKSSRNRESLRSLLENHIVTGRLTIESALASTPVQTKLGSSLRVERDQTSRVRIQFSEKSFTTVLAADLSATNGLIHVVDAPIIPPAGLKLTPEGRLVVGIHVNETGPVLSSQFALDGKRALVVEGLTRGGPAETAGVRVNDVIVTFNGHIATNSELTRIKSEVGYRGVIEFIIFRKGEKMVINVPVGVER